MRAVRIDRITYGKDVILSKVDVPSVKPDWVLVQVKAFGLNNSERELRHGEVEQNWIKKPIVPGIECAGVVADPSNTDLKVGQRVVASMGGMGRSFDGGYAEYALLPRKNVFVVPDFIEWTWLELGGFPETYLTAWGSLFECLQLRQSDLLMIRGATCGLGYASIQLAKGLGARVVGTAHRAENLELLKAAGVDRAVLDEGRLSGKVLPMNKILDLVGPRVLRDSLRCTARGAIVCSTGILGGQIALQNFDPIKDIPNSVYLTGYFSNFPTQETFDAMFTFMAKRGLAPIVNSMYAFDDVAGAISQQDAGSGGKIVVVLD